MKLLIENFRKYLKEQEEFDPYNRVVKLYTEVVKLYTDDQTLLDKLTDKGGDEESAASEIIEGMKNWIEREDALGEGQWNEEEALEVLKKSDKANEGETLQAAIKALIDQAKSNAQNI